MSSDAITFAVGLFGSDAVAMTKVVTLAGGRIVSVDPAPTPTRFRFREVAVDGLASLARAVWRASQVGEIAVRARPVSPIGRRAIYDHAERGRAGLVETPRRWVAFDWDSLAAEGDPLRDPEIGVRAALRILPPAFRDVSCGWQISASAGFKPGFRLRTWHWLDKPTTGAELKIWCQPAIERHLLDPVTLVEAQPHFLAVRFVGGADPCPQRFGILHQASDVVPVANIAWIKQRQDEAERAELLARYGPAPDRQRDPERARSYAERRLSDCIAAVRAAPDGAKHPSYVTEAARARAIAERFGLDWPPIARQLRDTYEATLDPREAKRRRRGSTDGVLRWIDRRGGQ